MKFLKALGLAVLLIGAMIFFLSVVKAVADLEVVTRTHVFWFFFLGGILALALCIMEFLE